MPMYSASRLRAESGSCTANMLRHACRAPVRPPAAHGRRRHALAATSGVASVPSTHAANWHAREATGFNGVSHTSPAPHTPAPSIAVAHNAHTRLDGKLRRHPATPSTVAPWPLPTGSMITMLTLQDEPHGKALLSTTWTQRIRSASRRRGTAWSAQHNLGCSARWAQSCLAFFLGCGERLRELEPEDGFLPRFLAGERLRERESDFEYEELDEPLRLLEPLRELLRPLAALSPLPSLPPPLPACIGLRLRLGLPRPPPLRLGLRDSRVAGLAGLAGLSPLPLLALLLGLRDLRVAGLAGLSALPLLALGLPLTLAFASLGLRLLELLPLRDEEPLPLRELEEEDRLPLRERLLLLLELPLLLLPLRLLERLPLLLLPLLLPEPELELLLLPEPELERLPESESESESELLSESESLLLLPPPAGVLAGTGACGTIRFGAFLRCSRKLSVRPPRPMAVQKLMAKRVFLAVSLGKSPTKEGCMCPSVSRSRKSRTPMYSAISWKKTLMKMRLEDVVSSSVITMYSMTPHGSASEWIRWAKNLAMLRSLFVSRRWIIEYCLANVSSKTA